MTKPSGKKVVLITGCSSGLGKATSELFAEKGWDVVATMLDPTCESGVELSKIADMIVLELDVTQESTVLSAVEKTVKTFGRLDVLINNAGIAVSGPVELATSEQIFKQCNTNLLGPIRVMQKVVPVMRAQKSGIIVNVSSIGGFIPLPLNALYNGTKYGLEGVSESMALEVAPFGIKVRLVQPGFILNDFSVKSMERISSETVKDYGPIYENTQKKYRTMIDKASTSESIAEVVYEAATFEGSKLRFIAGDDAIELLAR